MSHQYNDKVLDHFSNPRNVGEIKDADGVGQIGNPACGDIMKISLKVEKRKCPQCQGMGAPNDIPCDYCAGGGVIEVVSEAKFKTFGCGAAIANSSMLTEMVKGKEVQEAVKIKSGDIAEALGGLPPVKMHCSALAVDALKAALNDYRAKQRR